MDEANRIIRTILRDLRGIVRPGVTTLEMDRFAEERILSEGGVPAFKGYPHRNDGRDFPGTICSSLNGEVVHGVPSENVRLEEGDIISVDLGVRYKGYYGDSAETFPVGTVSEEADRLMAVTRQALNLGIAQVRPDGRVSDIGHAVQSHVEANGFSVVREFVGHGIGSELHEEPQVPNFGKPGRGTRLAPGMVLAIEPMVNAGGADVMISADDGWTARTRDGSLSAHFEVSVAVTETGYRVLGEPTPGKE
ncbi:MAG: type I methionyl aminopeptidase [Acidobacteria bacterium]|uniref:Methionine aminopeptidase n=1 Tax=Candidatus Polarisedimenticola svalbardensis TaxID=2886004 RepID=A0A8J6Y5W8_9BACT|nr:type I methionyl aminopeptidase [Candidatus Polarisedimenticola svalbardensis]